jgi:hypothetical protein
MNPVCFVDGQGFAVVYDSGRLGYTEEFVEATEAAPKDWKEKMGNTQYSLLQLHTEPAADPVPELVAANPR